MLLIESGLAVPQFGNLGFLIGEFAGVFLDQLLLAADRGKAGDVLAIAVFVAGKVVDLVGYGALFGVGVGELGLEIRDLLELPPGGVAYGLVPNVCQQAVGIQGRDGDLRIVDVFFRNWEVERPAGGQLHFKSVNVVGGFDGLRRIDQIE